jgi:hypothetical protein
MLGTRLLVKTTFYGSRAPTENTAGVRANVTDENDMTTGRKTRLLQLGTLESLFAGALAVAVGGWVLCIESLGSVHPDWVAVKPNGALCLILAVLALLLFRLPSTPDPQPRPLFHSLSRLYELLAVAIRLPSLAVFTFGWRPAIDPLLIADTAPSGGGSP